MKEISYEETNPENRVSKQNSVQDNNNNYNIHFCFQMQKAKKVCIPWNSNNV